MSYRHRDPEDEMIDVDRRSGFRDAPPWLLWGMTFINRVGFPIAVCIYLGWVQFKAMPKLVEAIQNMNFTMGRVETALSENTNAVKSWKTAAHRHNDD